MKQTGSVGYVALSGGIDSSTVLGIAHDRHEGNVVAVSFDYGQRHKKEIECARAICEAMGVLHMVVDLGTMPGSALTDASRDIPRVSYDEIQGVSPSYVHFRNGQIISKLAAIASADPSGSDTVIYVGTHAEDAYNDAYPDCRLDFIGAMAAAVYIGTYHKTRLSAPLIEMSKTEVVKAGMKYLVPLNLTWSCYLGGKVHCGTCPTCRARKEAFAAAGVMDPTVYAE